MVSPQAKRLAKIPAKPKTSLVVPDAVTIDTVSPQAPILTSFAHLFNVFGVPLTVGGNFVFVKGSSLVPTVTYQLIVFAYVS